MKLVLTCEHAFNSIPEEYKNLFAQDPAVLDTHEAFDPGAYDLFQFLLPLAEFSHYQETGRLLIEVNRSKWHKRLFSRYSEDLSGLEKAKIIESYYDPYRNLVQENIRQLIGSGNEVLHISAHSFTPIMNNEVRNCDIGLLYDPKRVAEKEFCNKWKSAILEEYPVLKIRLNYPYQGKSDGFTTSLRKEFPENYLGIELEVNQKWVENNTMEERLKRSIFRSLKLLK